MFIKVEVFMIMPHTAKNLVNALVAAAAAVVVATVVVVVVLVVVATATATDIGLAPA